MEEARKTSLLLFPPGDNCFPPHFSPFIVLPFLSYISIVFYFAPSSRLCASFSPYFSFPFASLHHFTVSGLNAMLDFIISIAGTKNMNCIREKKVKHKSLKAGWNTYLQLSHNRK